MFEFGELRKMMLKHTMILDGATSTMLGRYMIQNFKGIDFPDGFFNFEKAPCDLDVIVAPKEVLGLHLEYILSGAEIIKTNSFNLNTITLSNFGISDYTFQLNMKAATIAKSCTRVTNKIKQTVLGDGKMSKVIVAGTIGPSEIGLTALRDHHSLETMKRRMTAAYAEQARGLIVGNADVIMLETFYDALNLQCALDAIAELNREHNFKIPVMVSVTPDNEGKISSGETIKDIVGICKDYDSIESLGLNCGCGAQNMLRPLEALAEYSPYPITCHPNATIQENGEYRNSSPTEFAKSMSEIASKIKLRVVGGCCGTTPEHIHALKRSFRNLNYFDNIYAEGYSDN